MANENHQMHSTLTDVEAFNRLAHSFERSIVRNTDTNTLLARKSVARRLGITPNTIENFRSLRTKCVPHWLMNRIRSELVSALEKEAQNLAHEIQLHKHTSHRIDDDTLAAAETQLALAREILSHK